MIRPALFRPPFQEILELLDFGGRHPAVLEDSRHPPEELAQAPAGSAVIAEGGEESVEVGGQPGPLAPG
jgi:hypothetical protein